MDTGWLSHTVMKNLQKITSTGFKFSGEGTVNLQRAPMIAVKYSFFIGAVQFY